MNDDYRAVPAEDVTAGFSPERKARNASRAAEIIAEELALRDIRKARKITQEEVAARLGGKQVYVSRIERRSDVKMSTLRGYIQAIGGDLQLLVTFPEGQSVTIKDLGELPKKRRTASNRKTA